jgi:hypothetical protein
MENKKLILEQKITKLAVEQLMEKYNAGQIDEAGLASAIGGLKNLAGKVANKFVDKAKEVKQGLSDVGTEIKDTAKYIGNDIKTSAQNATKGVADSVGNIKQNIGNNIDKAKTAYKQGALPVQRKQTEQAFETFAKALNTYNQEARKYSAEPLSIQGMLNIYRRTYPNLFKESEEPICKTEVIKESEDKESKDEKWIQNADIKKGKLKKRLGLADDEKLTISRVNSELKHLKAKYKEGEKMSKEDLTFEKELNLAKTLLSSKK